MSAALDIGSNSVHLLVARLDPDEQLVPLLDVSHQADIGRQVDTTGELGPELREMLLATLDDYLDHARRWGASTMLVLGTEAVRLATDTAQLATDLRARTGLTLTVVDRATEALLTMLGVTGGRASSSLAVIDIGGGSTEVTITRPDGPPVIGLMPTGSARLAAAYVQHDPPTGAEIAALRRAARDHAAGLDVPQARRGVVAGGSGTNVSRLLGRERTTPVDRVALEAAVDLLRTRHSEMLAAGTGLTARRVAQLAAGIAIGEALFDRLGLDIVEVSDASLREGALIANRRAGDGWLEAVPALVEGRRAMEDADPALEWPDRAS